MGLEQLKVIGNGDAFGTGGRYHTCFCLESSETKFLVDLGEDPNIVNHRGDTLLIMACRSADTDRIRFALSLNPDIDAMNSAGETALMICCRYHDDGETAKLLIRRGADPFLKGPDGRTALDIAAQFKSGSAVDSIRKHI